MRRNWSITLLTKLPYLVSLEPKKGSLGCLNKQPNYPGQEYQVASLIRIDHRKLHVPKSGYLTHLRYLYIIQKPPPRSKAVGLRRQRESAVAAPLWGAAARQNSPILKIKLRCTAVAAGALHGQTDS